MARATAVQWALTVRLNFENFLVLNFRLKMINLGKNQENKK